MKNYRSGLCYWKLKAEQNSKDAFLKSLIELKKRDKEFYYYLLDYFNSAEFKK